MALHDPVVAVPEGNVRETQDSLFNITFHLIIPDDELGWDGIDENVSIDINAGTDPSVKTQEMINKMQEIIGKYKRAKVVAKHAQLTAAIVTIQAGLVL